MREEYSDFKKVHLVWYAIVKFLGGIKKKLAILSAYRSIFGKIAPDTKIDDFLNITMDSVYKTTIMEFAKLLDTEHNGESENCSLRQLRTVCAENQHFPMGQEDSVICDLKKIGIHHQATIKKINNVRNKREAHNDLIDIFAFDKSYPTIDELIYLYREITVILSEISERILGVSLSFGDFEKLTTEYSLLLNELIKTR